jgi:hypothetical protein
MTVWAMRDAPPRRHCLFYWISGTFVNPLVLRLEARGTFVYSGSRARGGAEFRLELGAPREKLAARLSKKRLTYG